MSDKRTLSDILKKDKRGGLYRKMRDKAPLWVTLNMVRFAPADAFDAKIPVAEPPEEALAVVRKTSRAQARRAEFIAL